VIFRRHEPGRKLEISDVFVGSGPHLQEETGSPAAGSTADEGADDGCRMTASPRVGVLMPQIVTLTSPTSLVSIVSTYCDDLMVSS